MDNLTHTLFALTLARTPLGRAGRGTTAALVIASNAPDIDVLAAARRGVASYLQWHRGPTHGLLAIIGLGAVTAGIVWLAGQFRQTDRGGPRASFGMLLAISMLGVLLHILMDFPTSYGIRLLSPFDWHWFAADWLPIIDIYLLIALGAALAFGRGSPESRRRNAAVALLLTAANYGLRGAAHHQALALAPRVFGPTLPQPCSGRPPGYTFVDHWPQPYPSVSVDQPGKRCLVEIAAIPMFISPFRWRIVAHLSNAYELHDLDLLDPRFRTPAQEPEGMWRRTVRYLDVWTPPVVAAARAESAQIFLGFSRFPAARSLTEATGITTVRWTDMRFAGRLPTPQQPAGQPQPFMTTVRVDADNRILSDQISR